ncbi:uncharacterized protein LY89DRAFT_101948 [Mollisia scopiformis]|uniref:Stress-response A/B barrel domain-containing protein n=1 Tax=Mollisia scopiformis TaxID=149040 RepID=A0A194X7A3_MOLSC|nr:uncharacterized protein LY89DRAFT_101948 [Mollisia scopiformis]KUJ16046.1 hypothetical protein LY89DRAFT_101948 [Mollisia scopiformis]
MTTEITRVTMIKIPEQYLDIALKGFETFTKNQKKDGEPYILSMAAGLAQGHVKEQGYTFVTKSVFKSKDDMEYYEKKCEGHLEYKKFLKENASVEGLMTCYFTSGVSWEIS